MSASCAHAVRRGARATGGIRTRSWARRFCSRPIAGSPTAATRRCPSGSTSSRIRSRSIAATRSCTARTCVPKGLTRPKRSPRPGSSRRSGTPERSRLMAGMLARYEALLAAGELQADPDQRAAAVKLDALQGQLEAAENTPGLFGKLLGRKPGRIRGAYLWGGVGRGTSMLMVLFHQPLAIPEKRRVHFNAFMLEVQDLLR